jgi:glutaredoxin 3|tara:strand:+ start:1566 stop:1823 length:258 start_codon:yes stop_codon:yes gene_type:complete
MATVEIYTSAYCPFCTRAIALLKQKSVDYTEINIGANPELRSAMIERSNGGYTVPQIFINDNHVGGCDQLMALEYDGKLDGLLAE